MSAYLQIAKGLEETGSDAEDGPQSVNECILIVDFGSQYSHLIARRVRDLKVYSEIVSASSSWESVQHVNPKGVILSGGPASVYEPGAPLVPDWVFERELPILGVCYGMQALVHQLGGKVVRGTMQEYGSAVLHQDAAEVSLFQGMPPTFQVWMSHGDRVEELPPGFASVAYTENSPVAAIGNGKGIYGLQFHPEVQHTPLGTPILENFLFRSCHCLGAWTPRNFVADSIRRVRDQIGDGQVICALSGGVDSAVTAVLLHEAIGDQLTCIFVNNGLLRLEEAERVQATFNRNLGLNLIYSEATDRFLDRLAGVTDPEVKRKVIGEEFIRVFEETASDMERSISWPRVPFTLTSLRATRRKTGPRPASRLIIMWGACPNT